MIGFEKQIRSLRLDQVNVSGAKKHGEEGEREIL
jgi:hypothetical protein